MHRNQAGSSSLRKGLIYMVSCAGSGAASGLFLGFAGMYAALPTRVAVATLFAITALVATALEVVDHAVPPLQCDRETPQRWLHAGPLRWAVRNGLALGCGATTRIGFWLWYAIPIAALLSASPAFGAGVFATYGFTRGLVPFAVTAVFTRKPDWNYGMWLIARRDLAGAVAAGQLAFVAMTVLVAVAKGGGNAL